MMQERYYAFAGLEFAIRMPANRMYTEERWLSVFRVPAVRDPHVFTFEVVEQLPAPSGEPIIALPGNRYYREGAATVRYVGAVDQGWEPAYLRAEYGEKHHRVLLTAAQINGQIDVYYVLTAMRAEHWLNRSSGVVFHCSVVDHGGKAILFTAPSGTGKSTQADLWQQHRDARIVNGDRAALRLADGRILAEGLPFAGSSSYCENRSLPIEAIVYLAQAPQTTIRRLRGYEAFCRIWEGVSVNTWDRTDMELASALVQKTVEQVPVYFLPCTPDETAVIVLEDALRKLECL